jgi:hypothetical protein
MGVRRVIRVCLVVSMALVVALTACQSDKAALPTSTPAAPTTATSSNTPLTAAQQQEITDLTSHDPNVLRITQGLSIANTEVVPWYNSQGTLIGAGVAMTLAQPATIEGEWRTVNWDSSRTLYGVTILTARLSNVTTINVWVDLTKGAVVGWSPNRTAKPETAPLIIATPATQ